MGGNKPLARPVLWVLYEGKEGIPSVSRQVEYDFLRPSCYAINAQYLWGYAYVLSSSLFSFSRFSYIFSCNVIIHAYVFEIPTSMNYLLELLGPLTSVFSNINHVLIIRRRITSSFCGL